MTDITKPHNRLAVTAQADRNLAINQMMKHHRRQLKEGMSPKDIVMPLLMRWQDAYAASGLHMTTDEILIFLMRTTYKDLLKLESQGVC
ncbi:TPA: hypothetical protein JAN03_20260 [Citrobacter freundii]|nr:hypothetical protein [Citrobacter freundii]